MCNRHNRQGPCPSTSSQLSRTGTGTGTGKDGVRYCYNPCGAYWVMNSIPKKIHREHFNSCTNLIALKIPAKSCTYVICIQLIFVI